jgi:hypothetical protein
MDNMQPTMTEYSNGSRHWKVDDKLHREDGPAVEWADGTTEWAINGKLRRLDGPAVEWADGRKEWYLDGYSLPFDEWLDRNTELTKEEKVMMKLKYG